MPVQGLTRLRRHLFGRQAAFGTTVAATKAYPFKGVPEVELNWTDPEVDMGSIDPVAAPHREAPALTAPLTDPQLAYDTLPLLLAGFFGGSLEPTGAGTAKTWHFTPASETIDPIDPFTYEFGDDVLTDWYQFGDGILDSVEFTGPDGLGPVTTSMAWRFGSVRSTGATDAPVVGAVPTPGPGARRQPGARLPQGHGDLHRRHDGRARRRPGASTRCTTSRSGCRATSTRSGTPTASQTFDADAFVRTHADDRAGMHLRQDGRHRGHRLRVGRLDQRPERRPLHPPDVHLDGRGAERHPATRGRPRCRCATTPAPRARSAATPSSS